MANGQVGRKGVLGQIAFFAIIALSLVQDVTAGSLSASWSPVSDSRVAGYTIKYGTQSGNYSQSIDVGNSTSCIVPNLTEGTTYFFRVTAYDSNRAEGTPSAEVSAAVLKASNVGTSSINSSSAAVTWQTNKPAASQVEYGTTAAYGSSTVSTAVTVNPKHTLLNLSPKTLYHFRVRSQDEGGSISLSNDLTFTTSANTTGSACDCNKDGVVNAADLQLTINAVLLGDSSVNYDINKSGRVDATDLQALTNVILGVGICP